MRNVLTSTLYLFCLPHRLGLHYFIGITAALELILGALGWFALMPIALLLAMHLVIAGTAAWLLFLSRHLLTDIRFALLYTLFLIIAGPVALPLYFFLCSTYYVMRMRISSSAGMTAPAPQNAADTNAILITAERIALGFEDTKGSDNLEPWHDQLCYGDFTSKQRILARICRAYHPSYAPLLTQALADGDNAVRVVAATSLTKIEERYTRHILDAEKYRAEASLSTHERIKTDSLYAASCIEWANSGLLDPADKDTYFTHALHAIMNHEEEDVLQYVSLNAYLTLLLHSNEPEQALRVLNTHPQQEHKSLRLKHLRMQAFIQSGDFTELRRYHADAVQSHPHATDENDSDNFEDFDNMYAAHLPVPASLARQEAP